MTPEVPDRMVDQLRICTAKAIQGGFNEWDARSVPVVIEYGSGNIIHRTHHPLIFHRDYLEAICMGAMAGTEPLWYRAYTAMCRLDVLIKEDRDGREPLRFLCELVLSLPGPESNPYKAKRPLAEHVRSKV